jgi:hypothetical protein
MSNPFLKKYSTPDIYVSQPNITPSYTTTQPPMPQSLSVQIPKILPPVKKSITNRGKIFFGGKSSINREGLLKDMETYKKNSQRFIARPTDRRRATIFGEFTDEAMSYLGHQKKNKNFETDPCERTQKNSSERYPVNTEPEEYPSPLRKNERDLRSALNDLNALSLSPSKIDSKLRKKKKSSKPPKETERNFDHKNGGLELSLPEEEDRQKEANAIRRSSLLGPIMEQLKNETK